MDFYDDWDWEEYPEEIEELPEEFDRRDIYRKCLQTIPQSPSVTAPFTQGSLWGAGVRVRGPPGNAG